MMNDNNSNNNNNKNTDKSHDLINNNNNTTTITTTTTTPQSSSSLLRVPYGNLDDSSIYNYKNSNNIHHQQQQQQHRSIVSTTASHHRLHKHDDINKVYHVIHNNDNSNNIHHHSHVVTHNNSLRHHNNDDNYDEDESTSYHYNHNNEDINLKESNNSSNTHQFQYIVFCNGRIRIPNIYHYCYHHISIRQIALLLSLYCNIIITITKLIAYIQTLSLSVLAALLDSVLDVVSQLVLNYTENYSNNNMQKRSSAYYPAGASRFEPIGVLTCAALMGMSSFEVMKQSFISLLSYNTNNNNTTSTSVQPQLTSMYSMIGILLVKLFLLWLCKYASHKRYVTTSNTNNTNNNNNNNNTSSNMKEEEEDEVIVDDLNHHLSHKDNTGNSVETSLFTSSSTRTTASTSTTTTTIMNERSLLLPKHTHKDEEEDDATLLPTTMNQQPQQNDGIITEEIIDDPTLEALALDHWNDCLSNGVAAIALLCTFYSSKLWFLDPVGAIIISIYIIYSWYMTGKEQIEHLTGKIAPAEFIQELIDIANDFDERIVVDTVRAYHFGPKFLVEIEIVMNASTLLFESHDLGMDLQYEIEGKEEVERCFVHIDYQTRPYDEHVVSKVPELREKYLVKQPSVKQMRSTQSI